MLMLQVISSIQQSLTSNTMAPGECVRLMYPLGKMLSLLSPHEILPRLEPIISNHMQILDTISKAPPDQQGMIHDTGCLLLVRGAKMIVGSLCSPCRNTKTSFKIFFSRQEPRSVRVEIVDHVVHHSGHCSERR